MTDIREFNTVLQIEPYLEQREYEAKIERCEIEASWFFNKATAAQKAEFDAEMRSLLGVTGPRWDRARDAAKAKWNADTAEARALYERTVESYMQTGECSGELDDLWSELFDREAVSQMMAAE